MNRILCFMATFFGFVISVFCTKCCHGQKYDVLIYGGSAAGMAAAIQAARMDMSVVVIEPSPHIGGLTSGGLGATDIGNKAAIGGISREFYQRIKRHYQDLNNWKWQRREDYNSPRTKDQDQEDAMWTFEPHVAEKVLRQFANEYDIGMVLDERLVWKTGVEKSGNRITQIRMESGRTYNAKMYIDATYEGDLLAGAGVSYIVGREPNSRYQETLNGVQTKNATKHQLQPGVDPYIVQGDPSSGLLPGIDPEGPGTDGKGDSRVQAYCFRMCNTTHPKNRIPFAKPADYNELEFELLLRNFEAGAKIAPWHPIGMPNRKTDTNNNRGVSTDYIGESYDWAEADYDQRHAIYLKHLRYQQGFMWTLANHPRVPQKIRDEFSRWGNCRDEFVDNQGWPHQLYVREARRMIGDHVMTQHHCQGREKVTDAVGLAAYTMDSHNVQRYVDKNGQVRNEGDVQVGGFPPYPISYRCLTPQKQECSNLLVPVCLSATHIAYGSIRMEPVFMVLGQSSATAACIAIDHDLPVQDVQYEMLRSRLLKDAQVLTWEAQR